jgi:hypothetical protein
MNDLSRVDLNINRHDFFGGRFVCFLVVCVPKRKIQLPEIETLVGPGFGFDDQNTIVALIATVGFELASVDFQQFFLLRCSAVSQHTERTPVPSGQ